MVVGAKGIILIFNMIAFVQSEHLEIGVAIQMHLVKPRIEVLLLKIVTCPGGGAMTTNNMFCGAGSQPKMREMLNPQTGRKARSTDIRNNNIHYLHLVQLHFGQQTEFKVGLLPGRVMVTSAQIRGKSSTDQSQASQSSK